MDSPAAPYQPQHASSMKPRYNRLLKNAVTSAAMIALQIPSHSGAASVCVAYANGRRAATYSCDVERDSRGRVTFLQWQDGIASVKLGGWKRIDADCFAASEEPTYLICAQ
jgi:hypothetical protein